MKRLFFLMAASAAFFSCNKEVPAQVGQDDVVEYQTVTIKVDTIKTVTSKTQVDASGKVTWNEGDVIRVCMPANTNRSDGKKYYGLTADFTMQGEDGAASGFFQGSWNSSADCANYGYVMYPASVEFSSEWNSYYYRESTTLAYTIPEVQNAVDNTFDKDLNLSYGSISKSALNNNNASVSFHNMLGLIRIELPQEDLNIESITIESTNSNGSGVLCGRAVLNPVMSNGVYNISVATYPSNTPKITLKKEDGSELTPGAAYYAVVWPDHSHESLKLTFTNTDGLEAVRETKNTSPITFNAGEFRTLPIKSLSFDVAPYLDVDVTSLDMLARGSSSSFFVTANNTWEAVSSNTSWLTISADHDSKMIHVTATANPEPTTRTATITISSADLTRTVTVTQPPVYYRAASTSPVSAAANLEDGALYMIYFATGGSNNQIDSYCWKTNWDGDVSAQSFSNKAADATNDMVFKFHKTSSISGSWKTDGQKYNSACSGRLQSEYNGKYQTAGGSTILDFAGASSTDGVELIFANQWSDDTVFGSDIDVYNEDSRANTIYWTGGSSRSSGNLAWSSNMGSVPRKWFFIKVQEVQ